jgi:hypothetical protein
VDPDVDAAGDGAFRSDADELLLQLGEPRAAQRVRTALSAGDARARAPERGVRERVPSVTGRARSEPPDAAAGAGHGWRGREHASWRVPAAATPADAAGMEQLELLSEWVLWLDSCLLVEPAWGSSFWIGEAACMQLGDGCVSVGGRQRRCASSYFSREG